MPRPVSTRRGQSRPAFGEHGVGDVYLVNRLLEASAPFRVGWEGRRIEGFTSRERLFHHSVVGDLHLEHHRLAPCDHSELHLVMYTPVRTTDTPARLADLLGH